jgi:hypothetical protein
MTGRASSRSSTTSKVRFRDYDLRLCECRATRYKHIVNKSNVTYHWMADDCRDAEIDGIVQPPGGAWYTSCAFRAMLRISSRG